MLLNLAPLSLALYSPTVGGFGCFLALCCPILGGFWCLFALILGIFYPPELFFAIAQQGSQWVRTLCSWVRGFLALAEDFQISDHHPTPGFKPTLSTPTNDSSMCGFMWVSVYPPGCPTMHVTPTNNPAIFLAPFLPLQSPCLGLQYLQSCSRFFISFPVLIWLMNSFFKLIPSAFYLGRILWSFTWLMELCFQLYYWFNRTLILNLLGFIMGGGSGRAHSRVSFSCFCSIVFKIRSGSIACVRLPNLALRYLLRATLQM